jgi:hypothetical protein
MKKVSTVAANEGRNACQQLTVDLDLGDRSSWYCGLDERGELQWERKVGTTSCRALILRGGGPSH